MLQKREVKFSNDVLSVVVAVVSQASEYCHLSREDVYPERTRSSNCGDWLSIESTPNQTLCF